jgi:FkbM family methyltransferase
MSIAKSINKIGHAMLKTLLPSETRSFLRGVERDISRLRLSIRNAKKAFRPYESSYQLNIENFGGFAIAYREGTADELVIKESFKNDIYFPALPYKPQQDHVIMDVGAHIGTFTLLAASKVPKGKVYAVEASKESYNYLRINISLNNIKNVKSSLIALAGEKGEALLHHDDRNWGNSIMRGFTVLSGPQVLSLGAEKVATNTLAGLMTDYGISKLDFVKFNCEGAEFPIILSTPVEALARISNMLILYHLDIAQGYSLNVLVSHLNKSGFATEFRYQTNDRGWIIASR